jgi:hypothetical protein
MKAALVVLAVRHSQQQIACLPVVPIGKQAQTCNVVVCHLSVGSGVGSVCELCLLFILPE